MLAELVDAVVGVDTHRDTHEVEIALPDRRADRHLLRSATTPAATPSCWPGSSTTPPGRGWSCRSRAPAATASGWPARSPPPACRSSSASNPTARPAAAGQVRPDRRPPGRAGRAAAGRRPATHPARRRRPRGPADPARRPPRTHHHQHRPDQPAARPAAGDGDDNDRDLARGTLVDAMLAALAAAACPATPTATRPCATPRSAASPLALREAGRALADNRAQLQAILDDMAPGLTDRRGIGPVTAAQAIVGFSHPGRCRNDAAFAALAGTSPLPGQQRPHRAAPAQPRRRPRAQPRHAHHRHDPHALLPDDPGLRRPPHRRGQDHPRDPPLPRPGGIGACSDEVSPNGAASPGRSAHAPSS